MPIPEDLDLDSWINDPPSESSDSEDLDMNEIFVKAEKTNDIKRHYEPSPEELELRREARKLEQENNPHYLKHSSTSSKKNKYIHNDEYENTPIAELDIPVSLKISSQSHYRI